MAQPGDPMLSASGVSEAKSFHRKNADIAKKKRSQKI
jgi:hypothetical protein